MLRWSNYPISKYNINRNYYLEVVQYLNKSNEAKVHFSQVSQTQLETRIFIEWGKDKYIENYVEMFTCTFL